MDRDPAATGPAGFRPAREAEYERLLASADAERPAGGVLTVTGAPGAGKTTLVERAAARFAAADGRVLRAECSRSETELAFSCLHQLLRPVRADVDTLPPRQRGAVRTAFGLGEDDTAPDPMLIGTGVLTLLSELALEQPVLLVVDGAQWADGASLDALSFAARRLADEPVTTVLVTRGAPPDLTARQRNLHLAPLDRAAAGRVLDRQPVPPDPLTRELILDHAEGNLLALVELARAAAEHAPAPYGEGGPLAVPERLERVYANRLAALPAATRRAVVRLAAADTADPPPSVLSWLPDVGDPVWAPAEKAGLVTRTGGRPRGSHPLARLAVHQAAPADERRSAHRELAGLLRVQDPDRYAWHLAAAATGPNARVAAV
ncbi:ATP-binding protein, partial [Streptomyces sp. CRN 30]|uniref:ATP-binding protein n=1 Tax=Streptomyces sp. CRN 30 TaxID=3075613 RepID=UPI002A7EC6F2